MPRIRVLLGLGALSLFVAAPAPGATRDEWSQPTKKWSRGPVHCLLTEEEDSQFKNLETDEQRAKFIAEFWARRDPTPGTPVNEFADHFWKRVAEADAKFVQTTDSGAISDRGQIYILFGNPTRLAGGKNIEWVYENASDVDPPNFTILFRAVSGGNQLLLARKEVEAIILRNDHLRGLGEKARAMYAPAPEEQPAAVIADVPAAAPAVATEEQKILDGLSPDTPPPSDIAVRLQADIYEAQKGDSFVAVTLGVPRGEAPESSLVGFARFVPDSPDVQPVTLAAADSFEPAAAENSDAANPLLLFQGGAGLHPGRYTLLAGIHDTASGKVGIVRQPLEVPSYEGTELRLSSVTLLRKLARVEAAPATENRKVAFVLGSFRVVPALDPAFRLGSELAWYFHIYNAAVDPLTARPNVTVQYDIQLKQKGEYRAVTAPLVEKNRTSAVEAFSFPLVKPSPTQKGWVEGEYRLVVSVTDEVAKKSVSKEIYFSVIP
jgi:GWxTD domain-containing protein